MRFGRNVLRMTWNVCFVHFLSKAHCFPVLKRIWSQCDDFQIFDARNCDLAKKSCASPEKSVLYSESALFFRFEDNLRPASRFWELWRSKMQIGQNVLRMTWKERFVQFSWKAHCFSVLKRFWGLFHDFENFDAPKCDLAKTWHDLKRAFCTIFMESAQFSCVEEILRPVWRFWELWRSKMRFGRNVLRMTWNVRFVQFSSKAHCFPVLKRIWSQCDDFIFDARNCDLLRITWKERFVQFSWKAHCFPVLKRISSPRDNFENFDAPKCDLAETSCAWSEKCVLYNLVWRAHCFSVLKRIWGQFHDFENFDSQKCNLAKTCSIWPEKSVLSIFLKSPLFSFFKENLRIVWRFRDLWRSKMQIGQNVLRMTWKERFVQFSWKPHCFPVLERIWGQCDDFENYDARKCDLVKTCCAWPEKSVLYNFHGKRSVFPFWREY